MRRAPAFVPFCRTLAAFVLATLLGLAGTSGLPAHAADDRGGFGLPVGAVVPDGLSAVDQKGTLRNFPSLKRKQGLLLLFSRSLDWWSSCIRQAVAWNEKIDEVRALGYGIAFVTFDSRETMARFAERRQIAYPLLADPDSGIIGAFGVADDGYAPGSAWHGLARPSAFVIDADGVVRARFAGAGGSSHPDAEAVMEALRGKPGS